MGSIGIQDNYGIAQVMARAVLNYWYQRGIIDTNDLGAQVMAEMIIRDAELARRFCNTFCEIYEKNEQNLARSNFQRRK